MGKDRIKPKYTRELKKLKNLKKILYNLNDLFFPLSREVISPPTHDSPLMAQLGCLNGSYVNDLVSVNVSWDKLRNTNINSIVNGTSDNLANTSTVHLAGDTFITNQSVNGNPTTFQSSVYLQSSTEIYNTPFNAFGYTSVSLSQEGLLWTLWPLSRPSSQDKLTESSVYSPGFVFGTSIRPKYPIGQLGYFINNKLQGCTPLGGLQPDNETIVGKEITSSNYSTFFNLVPGIETMNAALITSTKQLVGLVVVKVTEQIARVFNPAGGIGSTNQFMYLGYDGWTVIRTTANPVSPMSSQVYISPQYFSQTTQNNYQVVFPPNFTETIYYKNSQRTIPAATNVGLTAYSVYASGLSNY